MRAFHIAMGIGWAAAWAGAFEINGRILAEDGRPVAGARVRLLARGDSALTDSAGAFRFDLDHAGLRRPDGPRAVPQARLRAGMLEYAAADRQEAVLDLFGSDGRMMSPSLRYRPASPGLQRISLAPLTAGMRGLGWLRLRAGAATRWMRILVLGSGTEPVALAPEPGAAKSSAPPAAALRKAAFAYIDTLRAEKAGYYPALGWVTDSTTGPDQYRLALWKNPSYGLAPAELAAWKAYLTKPSVEVKVYPFRVSLPPGLDEGKIELADGTEADTWSTSNCLPGPRPKSVRIAYTRQGRVYRDTVPLGPIWDLLDSYRAAGVDSLGTYGARYHLAWDWPQGYSAVPERDWIELMAISGFAEDHSISYPDAFQSGIGFGIEGGVTRHDVFDPARGSWDLEGSRNAKLGIQAEFTLAQREDHDLRVMLSRYAETAAIPIRFAFANAWPEGGLIQPGQTLRLQASAQPAAPAATLDLIAEGANSGLVMKAPWDGSSLDWLFNLPIRDTLSFRLRTWQTDPLGVLTVCQVPALSPVLRAVPSPIDTATNAFEPNETESAAALVPMGRWIEAAWDYRAPRNPDADYYRFQAAAGARVRLSLRNPNAGDIQLIQSFSDENSGFGPSPGTEMSLDYTLKTSGDHGFYVRPLNFDTGRYAFRIDLMP